MFPAILWFGKSKNITNINKWWRDNMKTCAGPSGMVSLIWSRFIITELDPPFPCYLSPVVKYLSQRHAFCSTQVGNGSKYCNNYGRACGVHDTVYLQVKIFLCFTWTPPSEITPWTSHFYKISNCVFLTYKFGVTFYCIKLNKKIHNL